jgi:hypothetical protein
VWEFVHAEKLSSYPLTADFPSCAPSWERDFCRQRLARRKRLRDDIYAQRPKVGDHLTQETAAKAAIAVAGLNILVSEDWVVETVELAAHHAVIETSLLLSQERVFSGQRRRPGIGLFAQNSEAEIALVRELTAHVFEISAVGVSSSKRLGLNPQQ